MREGNVPGEEDFLKYDVRTLSEHTVSLLAADANDAITKAAPYIATVPKDGSHSYGDFAARVSGTEPGRWIVTHKK